MMRVLSILILALAILAPDALSQSWQGSIGNNEPIRLAVREKLGEDVYEATFLVRPSQTEKTFIKQIQVQGDNWGDVLFPRDFDGANEKIHMLSKRQLFEWECLVKGKRVLSGSFYYPNFELAIESASITNIPHEVSGFSKRQILSKPMPPLQKGVNETLRVRITVNPQGEIIQSIPLLKGIPETEKLIIDALQNWRFAPLPSTVPQENQTGTITFHLKGK